MSNSEIIKVGNPFQHNRIVRSEYYTKISFKIKDNIINITAKIDTGSPYTIIGLGNWALYEYKNTILNNKSNIKVFDASDTQLDIEQYTVKDFKLTHDIKYDKLKILFSEKLGQKSVIGMDILSLYEIAYKFEGYNKHLQGTFYINNFEHSQNIISEHIKNSNSDILYPASILDIEDITFNEQVLEANYINQKIKDNKYNK